MSLTVLGQPATVAVLDANQDGLEVELVVGDAPANNGGTILGRRRRIIHTVPNAAVCRSLEKRIAVDFKGVPLTQALKQLATRVGVNYIVDHIGIEDAGVRADQPVTFKAEGVRFSRILDQILSPLGLDYVVTDEALRITSRQRAKGELVTYTYSVANLVGEGPDVDFSDLIEKITTTQQPESWDNVGGPGSVREFKTTVSLVIRQTADVHEQIAELLGKLREERQAAGTGAIPPAESTQP